MPTAKKRSAIAASATAKNRLKVQRTLPWNTKPTGKPTVGIDPGSRYTGFIILHGEVVIYSETIVRVGDMEATEYADQVCEKVAEILKSHEIFEDYEIRIGIEGVSDPKGFQRGKKSPINPKDIIRAAVVLGAVKRELKEYRTVIIPPGNNGSNHITQYPPVLNGQRPKDLPGSANGAGTRNHERSAFDVAVKATEAFRYQGDTK